MITKLGKTYSLLSKVLKKTGSQNKTSDIAIVKLDAIGDFFIFLTAINYVESKDLVDNKVTVFCSDLLIDLGKSFFPSFTWVGVNLGKFDSDSNYRNELINIYEKETFSELLNLVYSRDWKSDFLISSLSANKKIGFYGDEAKQGRVAKWLGSKAYDSLYDVKCETEFKSLTFLLSKVFTLKTSIKPIENKNKDKSIVIFPGASWFGKAWPIENFKEIVLKLITDTGLAIKICGGPGDLELAKAFEGLESDRVSILIGKTSLIELSNIIKKSQFILTNDTSAAHMAQFFNVKGLALIGGGHFGRFLPYSDKVDPIDSLIVLNKKMDCYGCNWNCHFNHGQRAVPCIADISVEEVYSSFKALI